MDCTNKMHWPRAQNSAFTSSDFLGDTAQQPCLVSGSFLPESPALAEQRDGADVLPGPSGSGRCLSVAAGAPGSPSFTHEGPQQTLHPQVQLPPDILQISLLPPVSADLPFTLIGPHRISLLTFSASSHHLVPWLLSSNSPQGCSCPGLFTHPGSSLSSSAVPCPSPLPPSLLQCSHSRHGLLSGQGPRPPSPRWAGGQTWVVPRS